MAGAAVYAAQDGLYALLDGSSTIANAKAEVSLGWPTNGLATKRTVWINGTVERFDTDRPVSGGLSAQNKDAQFVLRVMCLVQGPAVSYVQVRDETRALADAVEAVVDGDRTLNGSVWMAKVTGFQMDEATPAEGERAVAITLDVSCRAWIT